MPAAAQRKRSVRADGSPLAGLPRPAQRPLLWQLLHSYLGFNVLQLAILQPPQDVSRGVPADPEVQRVKGREELPPDLPSESIVRVSAASCCGRKTQQRAATPLGTESSRQTRSETSLPQWGRLEDEASRRAQGMELLTCEHSVETLSSGSPHPRWRAQCTRAGDAVSLTRHHPLLNQRASPAAPGSLLSGTSYCCSSCTMESPTKSTSGSLSLQSRTKRLCCSEVSGQVSCRHLCQDSSPAAPWLPLPPAPSSVLTRELLDTAPGSKAQQPPRCRQGQQLVCSAQDTRVNHGPGRCPQIHQPERPQLPRLLVTRTQPCVPLPRLTCDIHLSSP